MRLVAYFLLILIRVVLGCFVQAQKHNINSTVVIDVLARTVNWACILVTHQAR